jgi:hypothetical protein
MHHHTQHHCLFLNILISSSAEFSHHPIFLIRFLLEFIRQGAGFQSTSGCLFYTLHKNASNAGFKYSSFFLDVLALVPHPKQRMYDHRVAKSIFPSSR